MIATKLNALSTDLFGYDVKAKNDVVKANAADGSVKEFNRNSIIAEDRLATVEYFGRIANADKTNLVRYNERVKDYGKLQKEAWENTLLYCAALANKQIGKEPYTTIEQVRNDRSLYRNDTFLKALAAITEETIVPLFPAVMDDTTGRLVEWSEVAIGETKVYNIESNDFFLFDDDSWGSVSSKPYQYLYKSQIALTPKPATAKTKIKWYQDVVGGEAGRYFAAFMRGAYNKVYAVMLERFRDAIANSRYASSVLTYDSYSAANWNQAIMRAAALNGVSRNQLMALGTLTALSNVLPTVGTDGAVAGIQGMIGVEWVRDGFLGNVAGVDLVEYNLAVVPGTQNHNPEFLSLDDGEESESIYIIPRIGYAPMVGATAAGSPLTIMFTPEETADMTINISETIVFDIQPAFSQKIVKITV